MTHSEDQIAKLWKHSPASSSCSLMSMVTGATWPVLVAIGTTRPLRQLRPGQRLRSRPRIHLQGKGHFVPLLLPASKHHCHSGCHDWTGHQQSSPLQCCACHHVGSRSRSSASAPGKLQSGATLPVCRWRCTWDSLCTQHLWLCPQDESNNIRPRRLSCLTCRASGSRVQAAASVASS